MNHHRNHHRHHVLNSSSPGNPSIRVIPYSMSPPKQLIAWGGKPALTPPHSPLPPQSTGTASRPNTLEPDASTLDMLDVKAALSEKEIMVQEPAEKIHEEAKEELSWRETTPRPYPKRYELQGSVGAGFEEFGRGAWSVVYRAVECLPAKISAPLTPPLSPPNSPKQAGINRIVAVKAPSRSDAHQILQHEARILTYLHSFPHASEYLVPFRGYDHSMHSLVFSAIPLNLETHVKQASRTARANLSRDTMFNPVVGMKEWTDLAGHLINGLAFLHVRDCIHGDIKPANILLQPSTNAAILTPLLCDFSSARVMMPSTGDSPAERDEEIEEVTAVTPDYTSPELLVGLHGGDPSTRAIVTPASDVFSLGVTLLFAAIGGSPYACARLEVQKLAMAREGRPVDFARGGDGASRIMPGRRVDRIVSMGVAKEVKKRVDVKEWLRRMEEVVANDK